ncbi:MAG: hypothetical protein Q8K86_07345 [Candidatus Nanopelagicaceae bacterium]|nr:hypothetical protein [Candidatus Nanopelagicaceae bacterium]
MNRLPPSAPDRTQIADASGNVFEFDAETKAWIGKGVITTQPMVSEWEDGLVPPKLFDRIRKVETYEDDLKAVCKIDHTVTPPGYFYLLNSPDDLIRFYPESRERIRIEADRGRLTQKILRNVCIGPKGDRGPAGLAGRPGRPAGRERYIKPKVTATTMTIEAPLSLPLDTDVSLRLFRGNIQRTEIIFSIGGSSLQVKTISGDPVTVDSVEWADDKFQAVVSGDFSRGVWKIKIRQRGPAGLKGTPGSPFLTTPIQFLDTSGLISTEAVKGLRKTESGSLKFFRDDLSKEMCVQMLRASSSTAIDATTRWSSALVTMQDCKYVCTFTPELDLFEPDLNLPEWTPTKACADRERFDTVKFEWQDKEVELPFTILKDPRPESRCCQQDLFECFNQGDACPVEGRPLPPKRFIKKVGCPCECEPEKIELTVKCEEDCSSKRQCVLQPCSINGKQMKFEIEVKLEESAGDCIVGDVAVQIRFKFPTDHCKEELEEYIRNGGNPKSPCDVVITTEVLDTTGNVAPTTGEVISDPESLFSRLGQDVYVTKEECLSDLNKHYQAEQRSLATVDGTFQAVIVTDDAGSGDVVIPIGLQGTEGTATIEVIVNKDENECCLGFELEVCASVPCSKKKSSGPSQQPSGSSMKPSGSSGGSSILCPLCEEQPCTGAFPSENYCRKPAENTRGGDGKPTWRYGRATYVRDGVIVATPNKLPDRLETFFEINMFNDPPGQEEIPHNCREACIADVPDEGIDVYTFVYFERMNRNVDELVLFCCNGCDEVRYPGIIRYDIWGRVICFIQHFPKEAFTQMDRYGICPPPNIGIRRKACPICVQTGAREAGYVSFNQEIIANVVDLNRKDEYDEATYVKNSIEFPPPNGIPRLTELPKRVETYYEIDIVDDGSDRVLPIDLREICIPDHQPGVMEQVYTFVRLKRVGAASRKLPVHISETLFVNEWDVEFDIGEYEKVIGFIDEIDPDVCHPPKNSISGCDCSHLQTNPPQIPPAPGPDDDVNYQRTNLAVGGNYNFQGFFGEAATPVIILPLTDDMFVALYKGQEFSSLRRKICGQKSKFSGTVNAYFWVKNGTTQNQKIHVTITHVVTNFAGTAIATSSTVVDVDPGITVSGQITTPVAQNLFDNCGMIGSLNFSMTLDDCCFVAGKLRPGDDIIVPTDGSNMDTCALTEYEFDVCLPKNPLPPRILGDPPVEIPAEYVIGIDMHWNKVCQTSYDGRIKGPTYAGGGQYIRTATTPVVKMANESHSLLNAGKECCAAGQIGNDSFQICTGNEAQGEDFINDSISQLEQECRTRMFYCFRSQQVRITGNVIGVSATAGVFSVYAASYPANLVIGDHTKIEFNPTDEDKIIILDQLMRFSTGQLPALDDWVRAYLEFSGDWVLLSSIPFITVTGNPLELDYVDVTRLRGTVEYSNDCCVVKFKATSTCRPIRGSGAYQYGRDLPGIERCKDGPHFTSDPFGTGVRDRMAILSQACHIWNQFEGSKYVTETNGLSYYHLPKGRIFKEFGNHFDIAYHDCECPPPVPPGSSSSSSSGPYWPPASLRAGYCVRVDVQGKVKNVDSVKVGLETGLPAPASEMLFMAGWPDEKFDDQLGEFTREVQPTFEPPNPNVAWDGLWAFHLTFSYCECDLPPAGWLGDTCKAGSPVTPRFWASFEPFSFVRSVGGESQCMDLSDPMSLPTADYVVQVSPLTQCCCGKTACGDPPWGLCPDPADPAYPFYKYGDPYFLYVNSNPERPNDIYAYVGNPYLYRPGDDVEIFPIELHLGETVESVPLSYCIDKDRKAYTTFRFINVAAKKQRVKITQTAFASKDEVDILPGWEYLKTFVDEVPPDPNCEPKVNKLIFQAAEWKPTDPPLEEEGS